MPRFRVQEVHSIENESGSPTKIQSTIGEMILSSTVCRAKVESLNAETGEYRVVLQGTLDKEKTKWD
jgi:hypothetical protein